MRLGDAFAYDGVYRVQSKSSGGPSALSGRWLLPDSGELSEHIVNSRLAESPYWSGISLVRLGPAAVGSREGQFVDEPDILYKHDQFTPATGGPALPTNIVDVHKAVDNWRDRASVLEALLGRPSFTAVAAMLDVRRVVSDEYFVHEAGHCLGYDVASKQADGYFRVSGRISWPLVYIEEFRADLLAFGLAAELLEPSDAAAVFFYNVLLRLGVHLQGQRSGGTSPYGPIPLMLMSVLRRLGLIENGPGRSPALRFATLDPEQIVAVMRDCAAHATAELLEPEIEAPSRTDAAIVAAAYHRRVLRQDATFFSKICHGVR